MKGKYKKEKKIMRIKKIFSFIESLNNNELKQLMTYLNKELLMLRKKDGWSVVHELTQEIKFPGN